MLSSTNLTNEKVMSLIENLESEKVERTISQDDTDKFSKAVCAFSNDLSKSGLNGYLLIGVDDNGNLAGMKANDKLLTCIGGLRADGNILPQPIISVDTFSFDDGDVVVIEVQPSPFPPVRYKGVTWIRIGARKAVANEMEERILIEKRISNVSTFDIRPSLGNNINAIAVDIFKNQYLPNAVEEEYLSKDERSIEYQLESLRFYSSNYASVTNAALLLFGKSPERVIPGAYIQYVKFAGKSVTDKPVNEKKFSSNLVSLLPELDTFIKFVVIEQRPVPVSALREKTQYNYPTWAVRELLMNAIMHRDYESNAPVKFYHFSDRIEISNPGGLFGNARPENFPNVSDYRNPVIAEGMKVLGYVNKFNRGIAKVKQELDANGNPMPDFDYSNIGSFTVNVKSTYVETVAQKAGQETGQKAGQETAQETGQKTGQETAQETAQKPGQKAAQKTSQKAAQKTSQKPGQKTGQKPGQKPGQKAINEQILHLIKKNDRITTKEIAGIIGKSRSTVAKYIAGLKTNKKLERIGPDKGGYWKIIK